VLVRAASVRGIWSYLLPFQAMVTMSALYELIDGGAAAVFGRELGIAYVGAQGDPWDAQKDMMLAVVGTLLALGAIAVVDRWRRGPAARAS